MNYLVSVNNFEKLLLSYLKRELEKYFNAPFTVENTDIQVSPQLYNYNRNQYLAIPILRELAGKRLHPDNYSLGITDLDIYVPGANFVFGHTMKRCGLLSIARLKEELYSGKEDNNKTLSRFVKEAEYLFGRMYGLADCSTPRCIMNSVNTVQDIDYKSTGFCTNCLVELKLL